MGNYFKDRDDNLQSQFNLIATEYEEYRLPYPIELFQDILRYSKSCKKALEIGIGTGKATGPFLEAGIMVVAVEPNANMAKIAIEKNASKGALEILHGKFEDFDFNHQFDLVYAASSFQWIRSHKRMQMIAKCLRPGGVFAKFKTTTIINPMDGEGSKGLYNVYNGILPDYLPKDRSNEFKTKEEFKTAGFFNFIRKYYHRKIIYDVNKYIAFINTYTEYIILDESLKKGFERAVFDEIGDREIIVTQQCILDLGLFE